jgi:hypothetical protein
VVPSDLIRKINTPKLFQSRIYRTTKNTDIESPVWFQFRCLAPGSHQTTIVAMQEFSQHCTLYDWQLRRDSKYVPSNASILAAITSEGPPRLMCICFSISLIQRIDFRNAPRISTRSLTQFCTVTCIQYYAIQWRRISMRETNKLACGVIACTDRISCNEVRLHAVLVLRTHRNYDDYGWVCSNSE